MELALQSFGLHSQPRRMGQSPILFWVLTSPCRPEARGHVETQNVRNESAASTRTQSRSRCADAVAPIDLGPLRGVGGFRHPSHTRAYFAADRPPAATSRRRARD